MKKVLIDILIVVFAIVIIGAVVMFLNGSLEEFPTEEQIEKVRISASVVGVIGLLIEFFLVRLRLKK